MTTRDELKTALTRIKGVGDATAEAILDHFGVDLDAIAEASVQELKAVDGVGTTTAKAIRKRMRVVEEMGLHRPIGWIEHEDKRKNIPTDQLSQLVDVDEETEPDLAIYPRDPELDPQLVWRGKGALDADDLRVPIVPIYIQEKVVPQAIIENLRDTAQKDEPEPELTLFDDFDGVPEDAAFDFYQHEANWSNRMILGDALVAMTSLAEQESLKGKVQMIYVDPPYGISFRSNWQVSTRDRAVTDGKDISRQPEQVRAFRDTWKHGINSYLTYLRDRVQAAHVLLNESGSIFVQIGEDNLHTVRCLLDEVFGPDNAVAVITVQKTGGSSAGYLDAVSDYLLWYAREKSSLKYRQLYKEQRLGEDGASGFTKVLETGGGTRSMTKYERSGLEPLPTGARAFSSNPLTSDRPAGEGDLVEYQYQGRTYTPGSGTWKTNRSGMDRLAAAGRLLPTGQSLRYMRFLDDFGVYPLNNLWTDTWGFKRDKVYVVQTATAVIERCVLMTSDPGELVLDPTCGSGTTAFVAETWGRRWITIDTSRVALALARARVMGARYPYWLLADSEPGAVAEGEELGRAPIRPEDGFGEDVRKGFVYKRALHVMLSTIANCEEIGPGMSREEAERAIRRAADSEILYDQPYEDGHKVRVAGPFTIESLSPHRTLSPTISASPGDLEKGAVLRESDAAYADFGEMVLSNLERAGVQNGYKGERLNFEVLEPHPDGGWVSATGTFTSGNGDEKLVAISIGPEHGTVGRDQVAQAALEAAKLGAELLLVCGFAFDGGASDEASSASDRSFPVVGEKKMGRVRVLNVRMNADLMMDDELKQTGAGNLFMVFGEPDVDLERTDSGQLSVKLNGVDVYDPVDNEVRSSGPEDAMAWFIDTDYDGNQFFLRQAYFTGDAKKYDPYAQLKRALSDEINHEAWSSLHSTESIPFDPPVSGKIAVKVINHFGDEVLKVFSVA